MPDMYKSFTRGQIVHLPYLHGIVIPSSVVISLGFQLLTWRDEGPGADGTCLHYRLGANEEHTKKGPMFTLGRHTGIALSNNFGHQMEETALRNSLLFNNVKSHEDLSTTDDDEMSTFAANRPDQPQSHHQENQPPSTMD